LTFKLSDILRPSDYRPGHQFKFIQPKHDGVRLVVFKGEDGAVRMNTRDGKSDFWSYLEKIPAVMEAVSYLPRSTVLDCELHCPGVQATSIITMVKASDPRLRIEAFAVPWFNGVDQRDQDLIDVLNRLKSYWPWVTDTTILNPVPTVDSVTEELLQIARSKKMEGFILKEAHYKGWYKLKPVQTLDLVVLSTTISTSNLHRGKLKAIQVGTPAGKVLASVGSGFDQEWRHSIDPSTLVGRVAEVAYDSFAANGKLKFPRFVRWRDDKTPEECSAVE
jgi:ATP-dependent DNA ligase